MEHARPSPEAMLARVGHESARVGRGHLKIFFGAVPGVGKTYAMLEAARAMRAQGVDVVVGWIETHGRVDTARLVEGLERLAPRSSQHRSMAVLEFDLDAALERAPKLLLVDELAHTNAPGSRHARRWQDIVELIDAGIDVWTTLNVQHVESLNDVVAGITGVVVRETVPDSIIDGADEIEVVDLAPDDLLQRMREGKIYLPSQAQEAAQNFFRKGNLIALRQLVLQRAAQRIESQAREYKREHGIEAAWRTQERLLVAFDSTDSSADLLRSGKRMAAALRAPWIALTVEDPRHLIQAQDARERLAANVALAQRLGAEALVVRGDDVALQVLAVAHERGTTRILVGKPKPRQWWAWWRASLTERIIRSAGAIDVMVSSGEADAGEKRAISVQAAVPGREYFFAALCVGMSTVTCLLTRDLFTLADQAMIHLFGVLVASSRVSYIPSFLAAVASITALNFFFVPPYYTLAVSSARYIVTFGVMLIVAVVVSRRTVRMREDADAAREGERRAASLYAMSRDLGSAADLEQTAHTAISSIRAVLGRDAAIWVREGTGLRCLAGPQTGPLREPRELAVAEYVIDEGRPAGRGTDTLPAARCAHLPLIGMRGSFGAVSLDPGPGDAELAPSQVQLLQAFVAQTAAALERMFLRAESEHEHVAAERERMRNTLLSSVSHDLRTPLAAISGSAQVLLDPRNTLDAEHRRQMLETVREESERLGRLVRNLLDLTKIDSATQEPNREWVPVEECIESALARVRPRLGQRPVTTNSPDRVMEVYCDPVLLEQALVNLLENAAVHTPDGTPVQVDARQDGDHAVIEVHDRGPGVIPNESERIFERFYRGQDSRAVEGSGLGLAVVQAVARVHGGSASARARDGGGSSFALRIPGVRQADVKSR